MGLAIDTAALLLCTPLAQVGGVSQTPVPPRDSSADWTDERDPKERIGFLPTFSGGTASPTEAARVRVVLDPTFLEGLRERAKLVRVDERDAPAPVALTLRVKQP